jgi:hypothetical protein
MEITPVASALFWRIANENENDARKTYRSARPPDARGIVSNPVLKASAQSLTTP